VEVPAPSTDRCMCHLRYALGAAPEMSDRSL
jgi:hypothetical protein